MNIPAFKSIKLYSLVLKLNSVFTLKIMKKINLVYLLLLLGFTCFAQSVTIDPRANSTPIVDIKSTTEGMVMPKMTVAQRNAITGLTAGTQVYCTNCTPYGPYVYNGGTWVAMFQTTTVSPITYTVGQAAQGGIVFWIDPASGGQHGLVADRYDYGGRWHWSSFSDTHPYCGARATGYYGGEFNTNRMLENEDVRNDYSVAQKCRAYGGEGDNRDTFSYGDWYLPSLGELKLMYSLRNVIGNFNTTNKYWSSTEVTQSSSYVTDFVNGQEYISDKETYYAARCIRRF